MKHILTGLLLVTLFFGCKKDSSEENIYGYEVECDHCDISYLDVNQRQVQVRGQRSNWRIEFPSVSIIDLEIVATSLSSSNSMMVVHILENRSKVASRSGSGNVTTSYKSSSSGSNSGVTSSICGAPTKKGGRCQRKVSGGGRCWQHN